MSITYQYDMPDVVCGDCSGTVERHLRTIPFFKEQLFGVDPTEGKGVLTITLEEDHLSYFEVRDLLNEAIEPIGFSCVAPDDVNMRVKTENAGLVHSIKGGMGVGFGILLLILSIAMGSLPAWFMLTATLLTIPLTIYLGAESYQKAWKKLKVRRLTMDTLFSLSTLTILIVSVASLFVPMLPMMCEASLLIFGFRHIGLAVEHVFKRSNAMTRRFQDDAPKYVFKKTEDEVSSVLLSSIQKNDLIVLKEGDMIPVDGVFESDEGFISDCIVTGSNIPRHIIVNEQLYAGSLLIQAKKPLLFRASSTASASHLMKLDAKIARAKLEKSTLETKTQRILHYFIPTILGVAALSAIGVGVFFSVPLAIQCAISVLVSACPCTLGLITPLAIKIGIKKAADAGVVFNSAKKLETTDHVQAIVFDLNGTLTQGVPHYMRHSALPGSALSHDTLLNIMAHFEKGSVHPVAKAICDAARIKKTSDVMPDMMIQATDHAGRILEWKGQQYALGSESLMLAQGISLDSLERVRKNASLDEDECIVYLARAKQLIGYVVLHDGLREDAVHVISSLKHSDKQVYICTGADQKTALEYANRLEIDVQNIRSNCVSHASADSVQSKKNVIDELRKKGLCVAAVGDGGNDAEMLAAADVGFAISAGGDRHTEQQAAAVIQGHLLLPVLHAFSIAKRTVANIKQNLVFSLVYNIGTMFVTSGLLLALGIILNPALGAALMILQTSFILWNVTLFARQPAVVDVSTAEKNAKKSYQASNAASLLATMSPTISVSQVMLTVKPVNVNSLSIKSTGDQQDSISHLNTHLSLN